MLIFIRVGCVAQTEIRARQDVYIPVVETGMSPLRVIIARRYWTGIEKRRPK